MLDLTRFRLKYLNVRELDPDMEGLNFLLEQISQQKYLQTLKIFLSDEEKLEIFLASVSDNLGIEIYFIDIPDFIVTIKNRMKILTLVRNKKWVNQITLNEEVLYCKSLAGSIDSYLNS
mmetsp:Transcript_8212/g.7285  ORF Transcript_8212/g.7285 Transcript_8212/m.7285 type:complete len:119 (-) Transcript_8212:45-401(-)